MDLLDRAYGALVGGAIGDAMGMPASFLTREQIKNTYGYIKDFLKPDDDVQKYHGSLEAGDITDDTMESKKWAIEQKMLESTVIGPSTRRYLTALIEGRDPKETSGKGNTNGSAMRAAPIGVKYYNDIAKCIEAAVASSLPSHGSKPAVAAACAVAAAVSGGVHGGYSPNEILNMAYDAALYGEKKGADITAPMVSKRIKLIESIVDSVGEGSINDILDEIAGVFGASMFAYESVPVALAIFYAVNGNAKEGILGAVNTGDDADTNGSICGNICGAYSGASGLPDEWKERVQKTSSVDFKTEAQKLIG